jgi:sporulation and spore germination protein
MAAKVLRYGLVALLVSLIVTQTACRNKEAQPPTSQARVSATRAYERYFGPAPTVAKGTCYAFVIYFPSAKEPGKVVPFPFFTFDGGSIKKLALERLLGGMEAESYKGELIQPFAPGTRILDLTEQQGVVTANFGRTIFAAKTADESERAALNAIVLTLSQFSGVKEVRVRVEGKESGTVDGRDVANSFGYGSLKKQPLVPVESSVMPPSPPRLLGVTAVKDKGAKDVAEVSAYFDRPVEIKELALSDSSGKPFAGEVYHSVFDMAGVLKPDDPAQFKAQMPIKVRWKVIDKLGRPAEGENVWLLETKEH